MHQLKARYGDGFTHAEAVHAVYEAGLD